MSAEHRLFTPDLVTPARVASIRDDVLRLQGLSGLELRQTQDARDVFHLFCEGLNLGLIRAADKDENGAWSTNAWVKQGVLMGMKLGVIVPFSRDEETLKFSDKDTLPLRKVDAVKDNIRIVPGGTSIRNGSHIAKGVIMMPPVYVNVGAYVGEGTMLDSHSLAGSCAQIGEGCHISAGAQIGGVLEPINANPCIVEDDVMMGINSSISEGVILRNGVVLGAGVQITSSTPVYDIERNQIYRAEEGKPLTIPERAVVIPGIRLVKGEFAEINRLGYATPIIAKYRDPGTDAKTALEMALR